MASKRQREVIDYNEDREQGPDPPLQMSSLRSTSYWDDSIIELLKIEVSDVKLESIIEHEASLFEEAEALLMPYWRDEKWVRQIDIASLDVNKKIKTIIGKIKDICIAKSSISITKVAVDGFMDSLLHILGFDDYPCYMYPQYVYTAMVGYNHHTIRAKSDFGIISQESSRLLLVIEDKTMSNASHMNNWREAQMLGELFVAVHNVTLKMTTKVYPVHIYGIRVVGTLFTFYKTVATLEYVKESSKDFPKTSKMVIQRHPSVSDEPSGLVRYNICNAHDREMILKCMCSIQRFMCG